LGIVCPSGSGSKAIFLLAADEQLTSEFASLSPASSQTHVAAMTFELPKLMYEYNALEPFVDTNTMNIHHTKHHQAYVNNINNFISSVRGFFSLPFVRYGLGY
jgi:hypothetical protein